MNTIKWQSLRLTGTGPSSDDPGSSGFGGLQKTFAEHSFELGLEVKVEDSPLDGDEEFGQLQSPVSGQQLKDILSLCVKAAQSHILKHKPWWGRHYSLAYTLNFLLLITTITFIMLSIIDYNIRFYEV